MAASAAFPPATLSKRVPALIDLVGLTPHIDKRLQNFSKGMMQRAGLAQALIHEPDVIFLDEPTSGLDPLGRRMVRDIIRAQRERGATVFLNSHLLSEIEITCDQVVFIREGQVVTSRDMRVQQEEAVRVEVRARKLSDECVSGLSRWADSVQVDEERLTLTTPSRERLPDILRYLVGSGAEVYQFTPQRLVTRRVVHQRDGRGSGILMGVWIMAGITFREAARKKILWTALLAGAAFLLVFGIGLRFQVGDFRNSAVPPFLRYQVISAMLMIGLYTVDLLAVVMTTLTSVDTISGEITSGTIHAIATKPLARWQILIGKWLGFVAMAGVYVALMFWGTIAEGYWIGGVPAQHPVRGMLLVFLECIVALTVTFMFGTWFSTLDQRRHHAWPAGCRVSGRLAGTNERIHGRLATGDGRHNFKPDHAE